MVVGHWTIEYENSATTKKEEETEQNETSAHSPNGRRR